VVVVVGTPALMVVIMDSDVTPKFSFTAPSAIVGVKEVV